MHEGAANAMLLVVFVHIAGAVVSSFLHRENLVRSMINGRKLGEPRDSIRFNHAWLGALLLAAVVGRGARIGARSLVHRITSYNVCYTKLLRDRVFRRF